MVDWFYYDHGDGVWALRVNRCVFQLKSPSAFAYFSERTGHTRTILRLFGWRILFRRDSRG